jgi:putative tricarboxylic transport membrane protein
VNGANRYSFEQPWLMNGISYIPVMIGIFAVAEVYKTFIEQATASDELTQKGKVSMAFIKLGELFKMWRTLIKSSIIGTIIGIIPAAGGSIAAIVSYGEAVRSSKHPETFGQGEPEGVVAPESSNNAAVGGAMVPTMVLGIPGSPTAAVIMAAFMIHGLRPGPLLLKEQPILLYSIFLAIIIASVLLFVWGRFITKQFAYILRLPYPLLGTLIIALGVVGAYALQNSFYDVLIMFVFSIVGFLFNHFKYSSSAFILGLILGGIAENSLRKQLIIGDGSWAGFVTRPISLVILLLSLAGFLFPLLTKKKGAKAN